MNWGHAEETLQLNRIRNYDWLTKFFVYVEQKAAHSLERPKRVLEKKKK